MLCHDPWGNVTWNEQTVVEGAGTPRVFVTEYAYDGNNQLEQVTYPSGRVVDYIRWANGRIKEVKATMNGQTTTLVTGVGYYPFGPPIGIIYGNQTTQMRYLTEAYAPSQFDVIDAATSTTVASFGYALDPANNIDAIADLVTSETISYDYDALNRLNWDSAVSTAAPTYTYDGNGNRLTRTGGVNNFPSLTMTYQPSSNRMATFAGSGSAVSYDGMGNMTKRASVDFTYDHAGRMDTVYWLSTNTTNTLDYNGQGELARAKLTTPDLCTSNVITLAVEYFNFSPSGQLLHLSSENSGRIEYEYIWLDDLPIAQYQNSYDGSGTYTGATVTYLYSDHLGTPRLGMTDAGQVNYRFESDAFGESIETSGTVVRLRFPGQVSLGIEKINYNYLRTYDPGTGRYLESDPIGLQGGLNTYTYVGGNPVNFSDPTGLYWFRQSWQTPGTVGRPGTPVEPGGPISEFIERDVPAGYTFGEMHDKFVDAATGAGIPDWAANIPSMVPVYGAAVVTETLRSLGILPQPEPSAQCR